DVLCAANIQHDCSQFSCSLTASKVIQQERLDTACSCHTVKHGDDKHFVLNMASLHNYQQIAKVLP
ncbi:hypothetical protein K439DRAFT_1274388, partial [Ramaria rubella]